MKGASSGLTGTFQAGYQFQGPNGSDGGWCAVSSRDRANILPQHWSHATPDQSRSTMMDV